MMKPCSQLSLKAFPVPASLPFVLVQRGALLKPSRSLFMEAAEIITSSGKILFMSSFSSWGPTDIQKRGPHRTKGHNTVALKSWLAAADICGQGSSSPDFAAWGSEGASTGPCSDRTTTTLSPR
ncbi:hypothetical protein Hypma_008660 [Hypsizygus marmoreus]|uniref:Uncharacterized protein n=1 Tax=Hypsizygus marmoreus TaxID=39966 RepID=A0A369JXK2_HYPMA|nr:hypothetical protein Hypma_008660 [Hypsizygus marmoreus]